MGIAWSVACFSAVGFAINAHYTRRHLGYGAMTQLLDFLPIIAVSLPMAVGVYLLGQHWHVVSIVKLVVQVGAGVSCFLLVGWISKLTAMREAIAILRRRKAVAS